MKLAAAALLLTPVLALLPASVARADVRTETLVLTYSGGGDALRAEVNARARFWKESLTESLDPGDGWNEQDCGPFDVVAKRLSVTGVTTPATSSEIWLNVSFDDSGLPSGKAALRAIGARLEAACRGAVESAHDDLTLPALEAVKRTGQQQSEELAVLDAKIRFLTPDASDPPRQLEEVRAERARLTREFTDAKVAAAVATSELGAARSALERARKLLALERDVEAARRLPVDADAAAVKKLADLERVLDEARAGSPPLDVARERVFDLEITLVGAEQRRDALAEELTRLEEREAHFSAVAPDVTDLRERRAALASRLDATRAAVDAAARARGVVNVTVVRHLVSED